MVSPENRLRTLKHGLRHPKMTPPNGAVAGHASLVYKCPRSLEGVAGTISVMASLLHKAVCLIVPLVVVSSLRCSGQQAALPATADVDAIFEAYAGNASPGCELGVLRNGEFVYKKAYGMADLEHRVPLTTSAPIAVGSLAKQFTAAVVAKLARSGRLSLDDKFRKHFPELPSYAEQVTVRDLVHHISGIRDYLGLIAIGGEPDDFHTSEEEFLELMARQRALNFEPATQYLYSNSEYVLLAILVRRVTGKSLRQAAEEMLFAPLGMTHTKFDDRPTELIPDRVLGYSPRGKEFVVNMNASDGVTGDGALFTTVDDLRQWDRYLSSKDAEDLLVDANLKNGKPVHYGFGLQLVHIDSDRLIAHGGGFKGYRAEMFKFPDRGLTMFCLCNTSGSNPTSLLEKVSSLYLGRKIGGGSDSTDPSRPNASSPPAEPAGDLSIYAGRYYSADVDAAYEVRTAQGKLNFRCKHSIFDSSQQGKDRFRFSSYSIQFTMDATGKPTGFVLNAPRVWNLRFEKVNLSP
jgi:CubicO group peptidase (beta-lactamase class C family)